MKAKLVSGDEWDAFSPRSRRISRWHAGELRKIKRLFWHRERRRVLKVLIEARRSVNAGEER